jgi:hypothetical protein
MATRNFALASAASLALAGALLAATPGYAQSGYPRESTPAEMRKTDALNTQAAREAADAKADIDANAAAQADHARAEAQYEQKLDAHAQELQQNDAQQRDYTAKAQDYQDKVEAYQAERQRYEVNAQIYEEVLANLDDQRFALLTYPDQHLVVLSGAPAGSLDRALVRDRSGAVIGEIRTLSLPRVMVRLSNGQSVWVRSPRLRYDPDRRVVLTDLTPGDLAGMPRAVF